METKDETKENPRAERPIRLVWTVDAAASEFGVTNYTLKRRLNAANTEPDAAGKYSTVQICRALYGDKEAANLRLKDEQAKKIELENARYLGEHIPVEDAMRLNQRVCVGIRQIILRLPLPKSDIQDLLAEIQRLAEVDFTKAEALDEG